MGAGPLDRAPQEGHSLLPPAAQLNSCFPVQGCFNNSEANV